MKKILLLALVCITGLGSLYAQRPAKPASGAMPKTVLPPYTEATLKNGIRVIVVPDNRQPIVYFRAVVMAGTAADGKNIGAAAAVGSLLEKGTKTRTADDIAAKLDFYGASFGASSGVDAMNAFGSFLKKDMNSILPIYADMMRNPSFPEDEVAKYISQTESSLKAAKKNSSDPGRRMGRRLIYGEHPYGNFETEESIKQVTRDVISAWHDKYFNAENTMIAVIGDITEKEIIPILEKHFGDWKKGTRYRPMYPPLAETPGMQYTLIDRPASVQSSIRIQRLGLSRMDPDYDKAGFIAAIFAGNGLIGFQNRLFQNIREKHGYTYTPGGSLTSSLDRGVLVGVAEVRNSVTDSAIEQMLLEYRRLSTEDIPQQELDFAKGLVTGKYLMEIADPNLTGEKLLSIYQYGLPKDYYDTYPMRVQNFTAGDLRETAKRVFPPNDLHVIVTGDGTKILPKVERFAKPKIVDLDLNPVKSLTEAIAPSKLSLDEVLNKLYTAINKPSLEKVKSIEKTGDFVLTMPQGELAGTVYQVFAAPNKKYQKYEFHGMYTEEKIDGKNLYEGQMGQLALVEEPRAKYDVAATVFNEELHVKDPGMSVKLTGMKEIFSGPAYVLEVEKQGLVKERWFVDEKTGYITRKELKNEEGEIINDYSDFRNIGGIPIAHRIKTSGAQDLVMTFTTIKTNLAPPDDKLFTK
jgi:predicted Zn-dependent peptidase